MVAGEVQEGLEEVSVSEDDMLGIWKKGRATLRGVLLLRRGVEVRGIIPLEASFCARLRQAEDRKKVLWHPVVGLQ